MKSLMFVSAVLSALCPVAMVIIANCIAERNVPPLAETVVAQSVVVIKRLLQRQPNEHTDIIVRMMRLLDSVRVAG